MGNHFFGEVYVLTCCTTQKKYVGQTTKGALKRWDAHKKNAGKGRCFSQAIAKYGADDFTIEVVDWATNREDLDNREVLWISTLNTMSPFGYNLTKGGKGASGYKLSSEARAKMSARLKGKSKSASHAANISKALTGKKKSAEAISKTRRTGSSHSNETKRKMSASRKGKPKSAEHRLKIGLSGKGKHSAPRSASAIEKSRLAMIGRPRTQETKDKISRAKSGIPVPSETREKIRQTLLARYKARSSPSVGQPGWPYGSYTKGLKSTWGDFHSRIFLSTP